MDFHMPGMFCLWYIFEYESLCIEQVHNFAGTVTVTVEKAEAQVEHGEEVTVTVARAVAGLEWFFFFYFKKCQCLNQKMSLFAFTV